jgi:hypothetical protein
MLMNISTFKTMKNLLLFVVICCSGLSSNAQFDFDPNKMIDNLIGPINSDRPGQCLNAKTAGLLAIQVQTGFKYARTDLAANVNFRSLYVPTNIRIGLTNKWELNTSFYYLNTRTGDFDGSLPLFENKGFISPELGLRRVLLQGDGWKPFLTLQANMIFRAQNSVFAQQQMGSSFYLITSNRFDAVSVNTNLGVRFPGNGLMEPSYNWVLNFGIPAGKYLHFFVEGFGSFNHDFSSSALNADAGISVIPFNDLQIDIFGGMYNLTNTQNYWFIEAGLSYRFSFFKMLAKKKADQFMNGGFGGNG